MDAPIAIEAFSALAQPTRLAAFRRLISVFPDAVAAGEIARFCRVPHNTMSSHLAILARAGLVTVRRDGRAMNYFADLEGFRALVQFMLRDCCNGRAELCAPLIADLTCCPPAPTRKNAGG